MLFGWEEGGGCHTYLCIFICVFTTYPLAYVYSVSHYTSSCPAEPISFTLASELVSDYIDKYNHISKAGCRNIRDVAEFETMRIHAGEEYTLAD